MNIRRQQADNRFIAWRPLEKNTHAVPLHGYHTPQPGQFPSTYLSSYLVFQKKYFCFAVWCEGKRKSFIKVKPKLLSFLPRSQTLSCDVIYCIVLLPAEFYPFIHVFVLPGLLIIKSLFKPPTNFTSHCIADAFTWYALIWKFGCPILMLLLCLITNMCRYFIHSPIRLTPWKAS